MMNPEYVDRTWTSGGRRISGFPGWTMNRHTDGELHIFQGTQWLIVQNTPAERAFVREYAKALLEATEERADTLEGVQ